MRVNEQQHEEAVRVLRAEYYTCVKGMAEDLKDRLAKGEIADRESLLEAIHEEVDGSYWVIYTHANHQVLYVSDNHDACVEEYGTDGLVKDHGVNWALLAFCAMERDLYEQLDAIGVDVNDPLPEEEEDEEAEEESA